MKQDYKAKSVPMHHQIYCYIKQQIEDGIFKENDSIPSEVELQNQFSVSRITARRAMEDLAHDGYVRKQRGIGTIVLPRKSHRDMMNFSSFTISAKTQGDVPGSVILSCKEVEASVKVAELLEIEDGEVVYNLKRLRLLNGKIIAFHNSYISSRLGFTVSFEDFDSSTSLYEFIESKGIVLGSAKETCEAKLPSMEIRKHLFIDEYDPILYKERVTYSIDGKPLEYSENSYIADRYKYNIHIENVRR